MRRNGGRGEAALDSVTAYRQIIDGNRNVEKRKENNVDKKKYLISKVNNEWAGRIKTWEKRKKYKTKF